MKYAVLILLAVLYLTTEPTPCFQGCGFSSRLIFHFHHSNVWHLLANASCIYVMKKFRWFEAYAIAVGCSFVIVQPTVGISGMVFAAIGCNLGEHGLWKALLKCGVSAVLFGLLPGVGMMFHLACLSVGYLFTRCAKYSGVVNLWRMIR